MSTLDSDIIVQQNWHISLLEKGNKVQFFFFSSNKRVILHKSFLKNSSLSIVAHLMKIHLSKIMNIPLFILCSNLPLQLLKLIKFLSDFQILDYKKLETCFLNHFKKMELLFSQIGQEVHISSIFYSQNNLICLSVLVNLRIKTSNK